VTSLIHPHSESEGSQQRTRHVHQTREPAADQGEQREQQRMVAVGVVASADGAHQAEQIRPGGCDVQRIAPQRRDAGGRADGSAHPLR
jgi:hypothetical protein